MKKSLMLIGLLAVAAACWIWVVPDTARFGRRIADREQVLAARRAAEIADRVDWAAVQTEAVRDLATYLRFDTSNPPGRERDAAEWLAAKLVGEGIDARVEEWAPGRYGMIATLPGRHRGRPLILAHHIDVVPPGDEAWDHAPFAGEIVGDEIWGRGAVDDKGPGVMQIAAIVALRRQGVILDRDVVILAVPDEEAGGRRGMEAALERHPELARAEFALIGEPSFIFPVEGRVIAPVAVAEKGSVALRITLDGRGGHASTPGPGQPLESLSSAMARIASRSRPVRWQPEVEEMFGRLGQGVGGMRGWVLQRLSVAPLRRLILPFLAKDPGIAAMLRDTVAWTGLRSWIRYNVIPGRAEAMMDMRLLPGSEPGEALRWVRDELGLPSARIETYELKAGNRSEFHTPWFGAIEAVASTQYPDVAVVPLLAPGSSDARHLRAKGVTTYLASLARVDRAILETAHGQNERLPLSSLGEGARFVYAFLLVAAGEPDGQPVALRR